jgi:hypothetical protein
MHIKQLHEPFSLPDCFHSPSTRMTASSSSSRHPAASLLSSLHPVRTTVVGLYGCEPDELPLALTSDSPSWISRLHLSCTQNLAEHRKRAQGAQSCSFSYGNCNHVMSEASHRVISGVTSHLSSFSSLFFSRMTECRYIDTVGEILSSRSDV